MWAVPLATHAATNISWNALNFLPKRNFFCAPLDAQLPQSQLPAPLGTTSSPKTLSFRCDSQASRRGKTCKYIHKIIIIMKFWKCFARRRSACRTRPKRCCQQQRLRPSTRLPQSQMPNGNIERQACPKPRPRPRPRQLHSTTCHPHSNTCRILTLRVEAVARVLSFLAVA